LKNQFRSLDEDEVEFLDSVLESTRAKEAEVKKDTRKQLELFRRQREEAEKALLDQGRTEGGNTVAGDDEQWATSTRKRKRVKEPEGFKGIKLRKSSSTGDSTAAPGEKVKDASVAEAGSPVEPQKPDASPSDETGHHVAQPKPTMPTEPPKSSNKPTPPAKSALALGLGGYSSSDEDD
jgi:hypothetical protein